MSQAAATHVPYRPLRTRTTCTNVTGTAEPDRLLTTAAVTGLLAISRTTLWRLVNHDDPKRRVPAPIKVGNGSRWSERQLLEWIKRRTEPENGQMTG